MKNVALLSPASSPGWKSATSTSKPLRSAHLVYILYSIWAQSLLSVPPAPGCMETITSPESYSPDSMLAISVCSRSLLRALIMPMVSSMASASSSSSASSARAIMSSSFDLSLLYFVM